jgi:hypothetical protein
VSFSIFEFFALQWRAAILLDYFEMASAVLAISDFGVA